MYTSLETVPMLQSCGPSLSSFFFSEDRVDLLATAVKNSRNASSGVEIYKTTVPTSRYNITSIHASIHATH